jgi:hypothetical protein
MVAFIPTVAIVCIQGERRDMRERRGASRLCLWCSIGGQVRRPLEYSCRTRLLLISSIGVYHAISHFPSLLLGDCGGGRWFIEGRFCALPKEGEHSPS